MIYIYYILCAALFFLCQDETLLSLGVSENHLIGALTYQLAHIKITHLILNTLCLCLMFKPVYNLYCKTFGYTGQWRLFSICYLISAFAGIAGASNMPTIGGSGIVYCLLGMLIMLNPTRKQLLAYIWVAAAIVLQVFLGHSNIALHLIAFLVGSLAIIFKHAINKIKV